MPKPTPQWPLYSLAAAIGLLLIGMLVFIWSGAVIAPTPVPSPYYGSSADIASLSWPPAITNQSMAATLRPQKITDERVKLDKNAPAIALVIDDCGLNVADTKAANVLPPAITLAFLPYGIHSRSLAAAAQQAGHEILLHMPMQPTGAADPGPDALIAGLSTAEITARVQNGFAALPAGLVGLNNHMGSGFTTNATGMAAVMAQLKQRDLFFLDSVTSSKTAGIAAARLAGVPVLARDVFLDNTISETEITRQLTRTETVARQRGSAIAIGHPHPQTMRAINRWLKTIEQRGFRLVPLRALVPKG